jgi:hypothetical protein
LWHPQSEPSEYLFRVRTRKRSRLDELEAVEREVITLLGKRPPRVALLVEALKCYRAYLLRRELSVQAPGQRKRTTNTPDGSRPEMDIVLDDPGAYPPPGG